MKGIRAAQDRETRRHSAKEELPAIVDVVRSLGKRNGTKICVPQAGDRIAFSLISKDRYSYTLQTIQSLDSEGGFDLIWNDASVQPGVPALARNYRFRNAKLVEVNYGVGGGPDRAICFGLKRLLELGYDYIGLIENDIALKPGWFSRLMGLFSLGAADSLACGAATVRAYESRVLEYRSGYSIDWANGAGMVLFSRAAAELILGNYSALAMTTVSVRRFYAELFGVDLQTSEWAIWPVDQEIACTMDWGYTPLLYRHGYASLSSIPSLATDLEFDVKTTLRTQYVGIDKNEASVPYPRLAVRSTSGRP
jgi:hypothetical protein